MSGEEHELCIIAGAGASFGATRGNIPLTDSLALELIAQTQYSDSASIILHHVQNVMSPKEGKGLSFENALADALSNINLKLSSEIAQGYLAIRFGLWETFREYNGKIKTSLWNTFFRKLRLHSRISAKVFALTTNYDLLIEKALLEEWKGAGYENMGEVVHPHGCINLAMTCTDKVQVDAIPYPIKATGPVCNSVYVRYRNSVLAIADQAADWEILTAEPPAVGVNPLISLGFTKSSGTVGPQVRIPALEMPVAESKDPKLWDATAKLEASGRIQKADHILIIGWAAKDEHIVTTVRHALSQNKKANVQVLCADESEDVQERLDLHDNVSIPNNGTFDDRYLASEEFLDMAGPIGRSRP